MSWLWYFIEISVNLVEIGLYLYLMNSKFSKKVNSNLPCAAALILGTAGLSYIGFYKISWIPDYAYVSLVILVYVITTRNGRVLAKIFWVIIGVTLISATAIIGIAIGLLFPGVTLDMILREQSAIRFELLIFCKLVQAALFFFLASRKDTIRLSNRPTIILLILESFTSMLTIGLLIEYGLGPAPSLTSQLLMVGASMGVLITNLVVFALYESLSRQADNNLQMQTKLQEKDMLISHTEEIASLYEEMRGWRHDYHNHLQVILGYIQLKKYDKLENYLETLEKQIVRLQMPVNSGNFLFDSIISSKILLAQNQGIQIETNIQVLADLRMEDTDICILLGNLLDNAIESCRRITPQEIRKYINIEIGSIKGHFHITIENSTNGLVKMKGTTYLSDKTGKHHGLGIKRIDEIVSKYGGYVNRSHENMIFVTNIMFPLENILEPSCIASIYS